MAKVRISVDSSADLDYLVNERDIAVMPLWVNLGDDSLKDGENITPNDIYEYVDKTGHLPRTAARSPEEFKEFFASMVNDGYEVIHFNISSEMSVSHHNAVAAAKELDGKVTVIDSRNLSTGTGLLAMYAADLRDEGLEAAQIVQKVMPRIAHVQASFVIDKMKFLHKGGRCSSVAMYAASILKIKPSIMVTNGKMGVGKKYLGSINRAIENYVEDIFKEFNKPDLTRVFITHSTVEEETLQRVKKAVESRFKFKEVLITVAGCTITSHCGKGTLGVLYINDN